MAWNDRGGKVAARCGYPCESIGDRNDHQSGCVKCRRIRREETERVVVRAVAVNFLAGQMWGRWLLLPIALSRR